MFNKRGKSDFIISDVFPKTGIDANVLIDLILYKKAKDYFKNKEYNFPNKFLCTLNRVVGETKGVLINRYDYSEEKATKEIEKLIEELNIELFPMVKFEDDVELVEKIGSKYNLNDEDIAIIYGFWKYKVKNILVRDEAFENTCKELKIE